MSEPRCTCGGDNECCFPHEEIEERAQEIERLRKKKAVDIGFEYPWWNETPEEQATREVLQRTFDEVDGED